MQGVCWFVVAVSTGARAEQSSEWGIGSRTPRVGVAAGQYLPASTTTVPPLTHSSDFFFHQASKAASKSLSSIEGWPQGVPNPLLPPPDASSNSALLPLNPA
jgi:hypothetical protein